MPKFRSVAPLFILFGCLLLVGSVAPAHAQASPASPFKFPPATGLAIGRGPSAAASVPTAIYDEQLGITFSQGSASIAYNVTAVGQSDSSGYGPGYLLSAVTNNGYWYQVGVSFDWPYTVGGYVPGFAFNYEVFNSNGVSIFPSQGGGLENFSGAVSSGDNVALKLYFSGGDVIMSARDVTSGATESISYSDEGATTFVGLSEVANSNGFFTGLMTEWYHASPYYSNEGQVTYSNPQAISSAWMWMDEFNPSDLSWSGAFGVAAAGPSSYTAAPNTLQTFSTHGATEASDAYEFVTGYTAATTTTTSITLTPAAGSNPLSASNYFTVTYTSSGAQTTVTSQGGTMTLDTDTGTNVIISGTSTASTSSEEWVLDSQAAKVSIVSGLTATYDYYDLLAQPVSYSISGGGSPISPMISYSTAPTAASAQPSPAPVEVSLSLSPQTIWVARGSTVSITNPIPGASGERWIARTAQWVISGADLVSQPIPYVHQYNVTIGYAVSGGSGYIAPSVTCPQFGKQTSAALGSSLWADAGSPCSYTSVLAGSTQNQRWAIPSPSVTVSSAGPLSPVYYDQFYVTLGYAVEEGGSGYSAPTVACAEYGAQTGIPAGTPAWVDAGQSCAYPTTLPGSTQSERWAVSSPGAVISGSGASSMTYYNQYSLTIAYVVDGGGSPSPPTITGDLFGATTTVTLSSSSVTEWLDANSQYAVSNPLPSSTSSERWSTEAATTGSLDGPVTLSATFYHQFLISAQFALVGGETSATPALSYTSFGGATSAALSNSPQSFWADSGSQYAGTASLSGSSSSERWLSSRNSGSVQGPTTLTFTYYHQFLLTVTGPFSSSQWYNASATATLSIQGVSNRTAGMGFRVTSYSLDGGAPTAVQPTVGTVTFTLLMSAAHQLSINSVKQYEVSLDASATKALVSITPPTVSGDDYWYDQGAAVRVILNGVWNRSSGVGERLVSYAVNGASANVSTASNVDALTLSSIISPDAVSAVITSQYQLSTGSGSIVSATAAPISGDAGWYDTGTSVALVYNYSWNSASGDSRTNAIGYAIGQSAPTSLKRAANGTFSVQVTMSAPQTIAIQSVTQYYFAVSGGYGVVLSQPSPTGDSFYDSGSALTVTTDYTWNIVDGNTRQNLFSFTLDGLVTNVTRADSGTFTTPTIAFAGPHELAFTPVTQYLISFQFKDSTGTHTITPSSFQIQVDDSQIISVTQSQIWLDSGTEYQIYSVMWEGANVKPATQSVYAVDAPANQTVTDRVFDARVVATDYLGFQLSGAQLSITLANGTTIQRSTPSNGTVNLGLIPLGTFHGSLSYLGTTTSIGGDASTQSQTPVKVFASYPTFALIALVLAVVLVGALVAVRRRSSPKSQQGAEPSS